MTVAYAWCGVSRLASVATVLALSSCAPERRGASGVPINSSNVLSQNQISYVRGVTAFDAVQRLHPIALNLGGAKSRNPTVYLDGMRLGGIGELQHIPAAGIYEI